MQSSNGLVLREIHQPEAPSWWPPAPGWWLVAVVVIAAVVLLLRFWLRRSRRRKAAVRLFDDALHAHDGAAARVAAISELLRRAARRSDPTADKLEGEAWLAFLDGSSRKKGRTAKPFSQGPGRLLLDGGFRRDLADEAVRDLLPLARKRYLELMAVRK
jgi:hypothetical protein